MTFPLRADRAGRGARCAFRRRWAARTASSCTDPVRYPAPIETMLVAQGDHAGGRDIRSRSCPPACCPASAPRGCRRSRRPRRHRGGAARPDRVPVRLPRAATSRLIPLVAVEELARSLALRSSTGRSCSATSAPASRRSRLPDRQGGFGLWRRRARAVPDRVRAVGPQAGGRRGARSRGGRRRRGRLLRGALSSAGARRRRSRRARRAGRPRLRAHVLGLLDHPSPATPPSCSRTSTRSALRPRFPGAGAGATSAASPRVIAILDDLLAVPERARAASFVRERPDLGYYLSNDVRTSAIATDAFLDLRPADPPLPEPVRASSPAAKRPLGDTQDNLYALVALSHYLKSRPPATCRAASLGGEAVLERRCRTGRSASGTCQSPSTPRPATGGAARRAGHPGHRGFYPALLRYRRDVKSRAARSESRSSAKCLDPEPGTPVRSRARGRRPWSTCGSPSRRPMPPHLAVDDPLPAGLEAVNTSS